jgi:hypothetical protein
MSKATATGRLSQGEQRALAAFLAGRLPAGRLDGELRRQREAAAAVHASAPAVPALTPALQAA